MQRLKDENSALLREDVRAGKTHFRGLPEVVTLNHTDLCNLRCIMCPRNLAQGTHRLSRDVLGYLAEELFPTARKLVLTTSGGEPLVADFDFLLEQSLRYELRIDVVTNGVLLKPSLYEEAVPALDHLNVSLDSHVPEVYAKIREGSSFDRVRKNLEGIREIRARSNDDLIYTTSAVVMRSNLPHLPEFVRFAAELGFQAVVLQKLQHTVKPTPDEEPETHLDPTLLQTKFAEAGEVARECGINVYCSDFGMQSIEVRPMRNKRPDLILNQRMCWFMAQNFGVMYTGEVYPCCIPTDHMLGNVFYEDPIEIWNGKRAQALRKAQLSGRGTPFCSGCLHAPHLPPPRSEKVTSAVRVVRRAARHVWGNVARPIQKRLSKPLHDAPRPRLTERDGRFAKDTDACRRDPVPFLANDLATVARDGQIWFVRDGVLRRGDLNGDVSDVIRLHDAPAPMATVVQFASDKVLLVGFAGGGRLLRVTLGDGDPMVSEALVFEDERTSARQRSVAMGDDGSILVGEYGVFSGVRARVHRASGASAPFHLAANFAWARHVHAIHPLANGDALVTTGDLAAQRRLLAINATDEVSTIERAWSGFTAIAETDNRLHFGTDLMSENALIRRTTLRDQAEVRPLPDALDMQVGDFARLPDNAGLVALVGAGEDMAKRREGRRSTMLFSRDDGDSWSVVHEFESDWSDAPEGLLPLPGSAPRVLTICSAEPYVFEF